MNRAISVSELYKKKRRLLQFEGVWHEAFGKPEYNARWFVMAAGGSGKTTFVAQLCKYLRGFGRVALNSVEEGDSEALKMAFKRAGIKARENIVVLNNESFDELQARLKKHKSPEIIVLDTIQHWFVKKSEYKQLIESNPHKMFVCVSHMKGKLPEGTVAMFARQDAAVKIRIEGFRVFVDSCRYGGGKGFDVWKEGADRYHGFE